MTNITFLDHFIASIEEEVDGMQQECNDCNGEIFNPCDFHAGTQDVINRMNVHKEEEEDKQAEALSARLCPGSGQHTFCTPDYGTTQCTVCGKYVEIRIDRERGSKGLADHELSPVSAENTARRTEGKEES